MRRQKMISGHGGFHPELRRDLALLRDALANAHLNGEHPVWGIVWEMLHTAELWRYSRHDHRFSQNVYTVSLEEGVMLKDIEDYQLCMNTRHEPGRRLVSKKTVLSDTLSLPVWQDRTLIEIANQLDLFLWSYIVLVPII